MNADAARLSVRGLAAAGIAILVAMLSPVSRAEDDAAPVTAAESMDAAMWGKGTIGGPFTLIDHTGRTRTDADFRGKTLVVYFGYSYCPDVCPTDLQSIATAIDMLGGAGENVQPLFVTVDPERDTPAHLADYVPLFHPRLVGLTGTAEAIRAAAAAYKVYFARYDPPKGGDYAVDHSGFIYVVDRDGRYVGFAPPNTPPERLAAILRGAVQP